MCSPRRSGLAVKLTLAALVPVLRTQGPDAPRRAARRFKLVAWPAYGVLLITGVWNIAALGPMGPSYRTTLIVKLILGSASGISAVLHSRSRSIVGVAVWGALTGFTALSALFLGGRARSARGSSRSRRRGTRRRRSRSPCSSPGRSRSADLPLA